MGNPYWFGLFKEWEVLHKLYIKQSKYLLVNGLDSKTNLSIFLIDIKAMITGQKQLT